MARNAAASRGCDSPAGEGEEEEAGLTTLFEARVPEKEREGETERDRARQRETYRDRETEIHTERDRDRQRQTDRDIESERARETEREIQKETETERQSWRSGVSKKSGVCNFDLTGRKRPEPATELTARMKQRGGGIKKRSSRNEFRAKLFF